MKLQEIIRNNYKFAGIAAASFLIDEGMKNYVEEYDVLDTPKEILDGKAVLQRYHNKGAFLNFGEQKRKLVTLLSVLLTVADYVSLKTGIAAIDRVVFNLADLCILIGTMAVVLGTSEL